MKVTQAQLPEEPTGLKLGNAETKINAEQTKMANPQTTKAKLNQPSESKQHLQLYACQTKVEASKLPVEPDTLKLNKAMIHHSKIPWTTDKQETMETSAKKATPKDTTGNEQAQNPAMTTSNLLIVKNQLHEKQTASKLFQQTRAKPLKNYLPNIKLLDAETPKQPGVTWPPPPTDESRTRH